MWEAAVPEFFWKPEGPHTPFYVGSGGSPYRVVGGECWDAETGQSVLIAKRDLTILSSRDTDAAFRCQVPGSSQAERIISELPLAAPDGALGLKWGATLSEITTARPDLVPPQFSALLISKPGDPSILAAAGKVLGSEGGGLRVLQGEKDFVLLRDDLLAGHVLELSDAAYLAARKVLPDRFGQGRPDAEASQAGWEYDGRLGATRIGLVHFRDQIRHGLAYLHSESRDTNHPEFGP